MSEHPPTPVAIVGMAAIMPEAPDATTFWANLREGRYCITDVPPERWDPEVYYDPDPAVPDRTYSTIGGWVRDYPWEPMAWRLPIPPKVADQMDVGQHWAVSAARSALLDAGWPTWSVDPERVAVILGNAIGGDKHYRTSLRINFPEFAGDLALAPSFASLAPDLRTRILAEWHDRFVGHEPDITEDTMPGELSNVLAGRVANLFNFRGPNFTTDAACASGLAAMSAAVNGLVGGDYDAVVTGGVDRNMSVNGFVKFCKIGALSATGTRPFDAGADGFVMGEGAAVFILKRLADAERDGDRVYAVLLGLGGSSDGKGKGITAPNPVGQRLAVERAWAHAGLKPAAASAVEAHGTSTRVGDAAELASLSDVFGGAAEGAIALGSVKSNIGHLKAAAGTAGLFKMAMQLHEKQLVPSLNFRDPNPNVDWDHIPFTVNTELREWPADPDGARRAGVSAFGFGGTNFHAVLEEHVPGLHRDDLEPRSFASVDVPKAASSTAWGVPRPPLRGALVVGGRDVADVLAQLEPISAAAEQGSAPPLQPPDPAVGSAALRVAIDHADAADLAAKIARTVKAFAADSPAMWKMLRAQGVFVGRGPAPKVAFLYTGQGSQYVNMLRDLRAQEPLVAETFAEADRVMTPLLGRPLSSYLFVDGEDPEAVARLEQDLRRTEITQPAVLATDLALTRLLGAYGVEPDMVMGHSLGEYGALVAAGSLSFQAALEAVSARGHEMATLTLEDPGAMAAVFGPLAEIEGVVADIDGAVVANLNSHSQAVIGGATAAVEQAVEVFTARGITAARIPVSHAFHTSIVAPATEPLKAALRRLDLRAPGRPIVSNVTGEFYPEGADPDTLLDLLGRQVASPVQFVKGLGTLYDAGARVFVEVGPKKALHGFVEDVLGEHDDVLALFTNHPKTGDVASVNAALCGLWAAGHGFSAAPADTGPTVPSVHAPTSTPTSTSIGTSTSQGAPVSNDTYLELGQMFAGVLEQGMHLYAGTSPAAGSPATPAAAPTALAEPVVITGAALGLPGVERVFDDENLQRILDGQQFIDSIPHKHRQAMVDLHITRLVKRESGDPTFEPIDDEAEVVKLAGRSAPLDVVAEFGVDAARDGALDQVTRLAIGAGFDALRDAGIPLVMRYKTTTLGSQLPERWGLPDALRDDTGVVFASAFPGYDSFAEDLSRYYTHRGRRDQLLALEAVRARMVGAEPAVTEVDRRIAELQHLLDVEPFAFDRRFLFRCLSMGHSQFAEIIGARGPNTQVNAACASTTQALSIAEDWIRAGRCRRVVVVSADDVTSDVLLPWVASGFLASGAAATDDSVEDAATPFDRRRHGMIVGMGAAAFVVETAEAARERGLQPICEVLGAVIANSAFHGTRLDVSHIAQVMESVVAQAERRGVKREEIADSMVFVSHETYTPARGGSASAEINALRSVFGKQAESIVITNTKGFTGHAMGAGVEDVVAVKALETGIVPPVPNYKEPDPELGHLNLSTGGAYPVRHALRLAAGFGSQVAMSLLRWTPLPDGRHRSPSELGYRYRILDPQRWQHWLDTVSGLPGAKLEVVTRRLRVVDAGPPQARPALAPEVPAARPATISPAHPPTPVETLATPVPEPDRLRYLDSDVVRQGTLDPAGTPAIAELAEARGQARAQAAAPQLEAEAAPAVGFADEVTDAVVAIVAEMTGYPPELLDLDLDLEADLGVDTVKQAEVFAAVRTRFGVERDETLQLRDFPTLSHVIGWVRDKTGLQPAAPGTPPAPAAPVVEPVETPAAGTGAGSGQAPDEVTDAVVAIVAEMTGYPPELLDLDLDLEADLGVDTVKQAEVFAAVRTRFGVERDETLQLRDFPTLSHVIGWVRDKTGLQPAAPGTPPAPAAPVVEPVETPAAVGFADEVTDAVVAIVAEMTGYPPELLDLDLDLEADLGVDTVKQAEVFAAVRTRFGVERDETLQLRDFPTLSHVIGWVRDKTGLQPAAPGTPPAPAAPVVEPVETPAAVGFADEVTDAVVAIVAEMTGYPPELLDLDLDLEADLGVDTVKQAEVFAAVRTRFGVERDETLQLRDFPTLSHVIGWVRDKTGLQPAAPGTPPAPAAPVVEPVETPAAVGLADEVTDAVVAIVAEMTGYPPELLDLDLDLEADLGVDTVKQAEVFAAVRTRFGVERDETLQLRDFPTLSHVIGWVRDKTGLQPTTGPTSGPSPAGSTAGPTEHVHPATIAGDFDAVDRLPRRIPVPALRPELAQCVATDITLDQSARVVVMRDEGGVGEALVTKLTKAGVEVLTLEPGLATEDLLARLDVWRAEGAVTGVYWLAALDDEGAHDALDHAGWREALRRRVKNLYATMRRLAADADRAPFLVTGTRLGGFHGYDDAGATAPLGGAVTGFAKSYQRERETGLIKAVDFPVSRKTTALADLLMEETVRDPGCVEVGHADGRRWGVGLRQVRFPAQGEEQAGLQLGPDSTVLVTGAAGSIVAAVTADLAAASGATFHLLDLTPEPDPADPDLAAYLADRDGLKTVLATRMKERGERPTPVAIEKELACFERLAAALTAIDAVRDAGGTVHYHAVDLTDAQQVAEVVERVRQTSGRLDLLVHAAGLEISRSLADKEAAEFDLVLDVKADGWFNLLHAAGDLPIGAMVVFSSVAGRFGNVGQTDYAAANDLLCKVTSNLRRTRPDTRAIAVDWTAWGGIGMATRGSIPKIMEMAGVEMLDPAAGVAWVRRELTAHPFRGEVVVAGALGRLAGGTHPTGGLDRATVDTSRTGPLVGEVVAADVHDGLVVRATLDPAAQPFLDHHRIDGTPVLPGVMGMEAFAEVARLLAPGLHVATVEDVDFKSPVKFYRDEPRTLTVTALLQPDGDELLAHCRLEAERKLPGSETPQRTVHFTGSVRLAATAPAAGKGTPVEAEHDDAVTPEEVYRLYFHGPAYQVVAEGWRENGGAAGRLAADLPVDRDPAEVPLAAGPRLAELCFQVAGLWEAGRKGRLALPAHVDRWEVLDEEAATGLVEGAVALAVPGSTSGSYDCEVVAPDGRVVLRMAGYRTVALPGELPDDVRVPLRRVMAGEP